MQPLHRLLDRIKWDSGFGRGAFAVAYLDRVAGEERIVPFAAITVERDAPTLSFEDKDGVRRRIPLHRVRRVYQDGRIIWERPAINPRGEKVRERNNR
jgi:uncharacterized protein (UPF0248 family)